MRLVVYFFKECIVIFTNLFPTHRLWPLTSCLLQELVKEMVDMDLELMKKNPNAWVQNQNQNQQQKPRRHSWIQTGGRPTFAFYDFLTLPFVRRAFMFLGLRDVKKKNEGGWNFFLVLFYLEYQEVLFVIYCWESFGTAFPINSEPLHFIFMVVTFVRVSVRVCRPSGFEGFYLHTQPLFSTGSPFFPFQELGFLRESDLICGKYLFPFQPFVFFKSKSSVN